MEQNRPSKFFLIIKLQHHISTYKNNAIWQIVALNVLVFLLWKCIELIEIVSGIDAVGVFRNLFLLPASFQSLIFRPWTMISYMFIHEGFIHLLFNMLWLHWIGQLFITYLGNKRVWRVYIGGGFIGALLFVLSYNTFPYLIPSASTSLAAGSSAGVLAIAVASATLLPNYEIELFFVGWVRLKLIVFFVVLFDLVSIPYSNTGGHLAHLGGAIFGLIYVKLFYNLNLFDLILKKLRKPKSNLKIHYKSKFMKLEDSQINYQKEIDTILDKINANGIHALSETEKEILKKLSNKI